MSVNKSGSIGSLDKSVSMTLSALAMNGDITLAGDIIPDADDTRSLGATTKDFLKIWNNDADAFAVAPTPASHTVNVHTDVARELFVPVQAPDATLSIYWQSTSLPNGAATYVPFTAKVPDDFVSLTSIHIVVVSDSAAGDIYWKENVKSASSNMDCIYFGKTNAVFTFSFDVITPGGRLIDSGEVDTVYKGEVWLISGTAGQSVEAEELIKR